MELTQKPVDQSKVTYKYVLVKLRTSDLVVCRSSYITSPNISFSMEEELIDLLIKWKMETTDLKLL